MAIESRNSGQGRQVVREGQTLYYEVIGEGPPVLLLHSFLCHLELWEHQVEALRTEFRVIAMDIRGHGKSGHSLPHSLDDLVDDALAVLDAEGVGAAHWCGLSIGGMISIRAALRVPQRIRSLVLMNTDAGAESRRVVWKHYGLEAIARLFGLSLVKKSVLTLMFGRTTRQQQPELLCRWEEAFMKLHVPSMMRTLHALDRRKDLVPLVGQIHRPALVLHGDEDQALPIRRGRLLADELPRAEWRSLPRVGHLSCIEAPQEVNRHLLAFLRNQDLR